MPIAFFWVLIVASVPPASAPAQTARPTNLQMLQSIITTLTHEIVSASKLAAPESVSVSARGDDERWIAEQGMQTTLRKLAMVPFGDSVGAGFHGSRLEVVPTLAVTYDKSVEGGIFGARAVQRTASAQFTYRTISIPGGEVLASGTVAAATSDTVSVDDIQSLEQPGMRSTQARLPDEGFFQRLAEPVMIIGAVGTMVYLLFHVRS